MPGRLHIKECQHCKRKFDYQYFHGTQELYCPYCHLVIESLSDYGFGPVWPAYFFVGSKEIAVIIEVGKYPNLKFELEIYNYEKQILNTQGKTNFLEVMTIGGPIVQDYVSSRNF